MFGDDQGPRPNHEHVVGALKEALALLREMRALLHEEHPEPRHPGPHGPDAAFDPA